MGEATVAGEGKKAVLVDVQPSRSTWIRWEVNDGREASEDEEPELEA